MRKADPPRYKIGDCFFTLPIEEAKELLEKSTEKLDVDVGELEGQLTQIRHDMESLKVALYARFGRTINLEL
jgi:prefoldin subunit 4